ncbi:hypothetical protein ACFSQE_17740 [Vogesella fluminis]|uniref:hypothetical protein n=1 Tax=Vogesella fluminis TaxID=1069161 RepID=UPI00363F28B1
MSPSGGLLTKRASGWPINSGKGRPSWIDASWLAAITVMSALSAMMKAPCKVSIMHWKFRSSGIDSPRHQSAGAVP